MKKRTQSRRRITFYLIPVAILILILMQGTVALAVGETTLDVDGGAGTVNTGDVCPSPRNSMVYADIQAAIDCSHEGDTIEVANGTYYENLTIPHYITLNGAGNGTDDTIDTIIDPASPGITILAGGADAVNRLVISNLTVQNASGGGNTGSGILIQGPATIEHITFDTISSLNNGGHGIGINHTGTVGDIIVTDSNLSDNAGSGFRIPSSIAVFDGLTINNSQIHDNITSGLNVNPTVSGADIDNINVDSTDFSGNASALGNQSDISLFAFEGNISLTNITVDTVATYGIQIRGVNGGTAPTVIMDNVDIDGSPQKTGLQIQLFDDVSNFSFNDVDLTGVTGAGWYPMAVDHVGSAPLDIGNMQLPVLGIPTTMSIWNTGGVDATGATFVGAIDNFDIEDHITHAVDLIASHGFVEWVDDNVFVTISSFAVPVTTEPSIQRAIDIASDGWTVNVGPGTFDEATIHVNKDVTVDGQGQGVTIVDPTANSVIFFIDHDGVTMSDMTIQDGSQGARYEMANGTIDNTEFNNVGFLNNTSRGIEIHNATTVTNLRVVDSFFDSNNNGFRLSSSAVGDGISITGTTFQNHSIGFYQANDGSTGHLRDLLIDNSVFNSQTGTAIFAEEIRDSVIQNSTFNDNRRGFTLFKAYSNAGTDVHNLVFDNNEFNDQANSAILIYISTGGLTDVIEITDNTFNQDVGALAANWAMVDLRLSTGLPYASIIIDGNDFNLSGTFGAATAAYGVKMRGASEAITINGNTFDGGNVGDNGGTPPTSAIWVATDDASHGATSASALIEVTNNEIVNFVHGVSVYDTVNGVYGNLPVGAQLNINNNNISGNGLFGVNNDGTSETVDATLNFWGAADGPSGEGPGSGDAITVNVDFCPWLESYPNGAVATIGGRYATTSADGHTARYCTIEGAMFASDAPNQVVHVSEGDWPYETMTRDYSDSPDLLVLAIGDRDNTVVNGVALTGSSFAGLTFENLTFSGDHPDFYGNYTVAITGSGDYADLAFVDNIFDGQDATDIGAVFINQGFDGFTLDSNLFKNFTASPATETSPGVFDNYSLVFVESTNDLSPAGRGNNYVATNNQFIDVRHLNALEAFRWQNVTMSGNNITGVFGRLIIWSYSSDPLLTVTVDNNTIDISAGNAEADSTGIGVYYAIGDVNITNNNVTGANTCLTTYGVTDLEVLGNNLSECVTRGQYFHDSAGYVAPISATIVGNTFSTGPVGVENAAQVFELNICDNTFIDITDPDFENPGPFAPCDPSNIVASKYDDTNANGQNDGETALEGWEMILYDADGVQVGGSQFTANDGTTTFAGLEVGHSYTVCEVEQVDWFNSQPGTIDPDFGAPCYDIMIDTFGMDYDAVFGNFQNTALLVSKYHDLNGNGTRQYGQNPEPGLQGWEFVLYNDQDVQIAGPQSTGPNGWTTFNNLTPGTYTVCEVEQEWWTNTEPAVINQTHDAPCYTVVITSDTVTRVRFGNQYIPHNDLAIVKSDDGNAVELGDEIVYTLTVTNNGPDTATGVTVTDTLSQHMGFVSAVSANATCNYDGNSHTIDCDVDDLANGQSIEITVTVTATRVGNLTNEASVVGDEPDTNPDNNSDIERTRVNWSTPRGEADICVVAGDLNFNEGTSLNGIMLNNLLAVTANGGDAQYIVTAGTSPTIWVTGGDNNYTPSGAGIADVTRVHDYSFVFNPDIIVTEFSVTVYDYGDYNPAGASEWGVNLSGSGAGVGADDTLYWTGGTVGGAGDSLAANPGQPGNRVYAISGSDLSGADLSFFFDGSPANYNASLVAGGQVIGGNSADPHIGMDRLCVTYSERPPEVGTLYVEKIVDWNGAIPNQNMTFEICITGATYPNGNCQVIDYDGGTLTWDNLEPGEYTVDEVDPIGWDVNEPANPVVVPEGDSTTAYVTNTLRQGSVTITKHVNWNGADPYAESFTICVDGATLAQPLCGSFGAGESQQWSLPAGNYSVYETGQGGQWTVSGETNIVIQPDLNVNVDITNTHDAPPVGSIEVTKVVDWNGAEEDAGMTFTLCVNGDELNAPWCQAVGYQGGSRLFDNLPVGSYNVYEWDPGDDWTVSGGGAVDVTDGGIAYVQITNTHDAPPPPVCEVGDNADLSGNITINGLTAYGTVYNNGPEECRYQVGMASYNKYDEIIDNQVLFAGFDTWVTIPAGGSIQLQIGLPECATQVDLFYGPYLLDLNGVRYGERLLEAIHLPGTGYCGDDPVIEEIPENNEVEGGEENP